MSADERRRNRNIDLSDADALFNRGNARRDKGDVEGAIDDYTEAHTCQPNGAAN